MQNCTDKSNMCAVVRYTDEQGEPVFEASEPTFDLDEYKIIRRFVRENSLCVVRLNASV